MHGSFVKIVPISNIEIIRKGAHLNFAMGATDDEVVNSLKRLCLKNNVYARHLLVSRKYRWVYLWIVHIR